VAIIGRNGAGKSTLLQLIAGTLTPTSGNIEVRGRVAALLQLGSGFNPEFTGRENVFLNGAILGFSRAEINHRFDEIAAFAEIGNFIDQPVKTYSSGMTMRLAFAVSTCLEPEVLIIDEALAVGDAVFQFKCRNRLQDLIIKGTTLLFVSHDISAVKSFCNRAIYLENGQKKVEGEAEHIAEYYFMDVRAEQTRSVPQKNKSIDTTIRKKTYGGYGTSEGEIVSANFTATRQNFAFFNYGDTIELEVICQFALHIKSPCLSIVIQASNLVGIGGQWFRINQPYSENKTATLKIKLPAKFNEGKYFITLRLEDRKDQKQSFILHKIPGALTFDVLSRTNNRLLGFNDLDLVCEQ
jgi:lipopolysaccharide transport system ATP-binding protein